jgi:DNA-binding NarL/FixJ family response regulator
MTGLTSTTSSRGDTQPGKTRILLADDHPFFRRGLAALISSLDDFIVVAEADSPQETLSRVRELPVDIAVLDLSFEGKNGLELAKQIRAEKPEVAIVLLTMHDEELYAIRALKSGAKGYVMKRENPEVLVEALRNVAAGDIHVSPRIKSSLVFQAVQSDGQPGSPLDLLTDRQLEVLQLFGEGHSTQEVARRLNLGAKTIETHRMHIKERLGFKSAPEMVRFAASWVRAQNGAPGDPAAKGRR